MRLSVKDLGFAYAEQTIIQDIHLQVAQGELVGIIGPNGSGKSTVLKNIYRALKPDKGTITLDDENLLTLNNKKSALKIGVLGQENTVPFDFSVADIVAMGRSPHKKWFDADTAYDRQIVHQALAHVGLTEMAERNFRYLSGGEKQRVLLARVLAQQTDFLIMDEPTNHLDIYYQIQMFDLIKAMGVTVLSAIHDLNLAALYCDRLYVMKNGQLEASGKPEDVLTPAIIETVYGVHADVTIHPMTNKAVITYLPQHLQRESIENEENDT